MKRLPIEGKAIINKKNELSTLRHAPTAEAALTLPARLPITSTWATSSRPPKDESGLHLPIISGQRKPVNMKVGARSPAPNVAVDRSGVNLPFHSKLQSTAIAPAVLTKMLPPTQRPGNETTISKDPTSVLSSPAPTTTTASALAEPSVPIAAHVILHPPKDKLLQPVKTKADVSKEQMKAKSSSLVHVTPELHKPSAPVSTQIAPSCPSDDKQNVPVPAVPISRQWPISKAVFNTCHMSTRQGLPTATTTPALTKPSAPTLPRCSVPPRLPQDERKPLVKVATMQRKSTVVSIKKTMGSNSAHWITKTCTRAPVASQRSGDFAPSNSSKKAIEESIQLK